MRVISSLSPTLLFSQWHEVCSLSNGWEAWEEGSLLNLVGDKYDLPHECWAALLLAHCLPNYWSSVLTIGANAEPD